MVTSTELKPRQTSRFSFPRLFKLLGTALLSLYLLVCAALWLGQGHLIFFPSKVLTVVPASYGVSYEHVLIPAGADQITGWWIQSNAPQAKTLLFLHGNGGNLSDNAAQAVRLNKLGFSVLIIDY